MGKPLFVGPKIRCAKCLRWYDPAWEFHKAHDFQRYRCNGITIGNLGIPADHEISRCTCGHVAIRLAKKKAG